MATIEAATQAGGQPVLVDISERDYCVDVAGVEAAVTANTRFLVPVHLYGQLADMTSLDAVARRHDLDILEDACQAPGATRDGRWAEAPDVRPRSASSLPRTSAPWATPVRV